MPVLITTSCKNKTKINQTQQSLENENVPTDLSKDWLFCSHGCKEPSEPVFNPLMTILQANQSMSVSHLRKTGNQEQMILVNRSLGK